MYDLSVTCRKNTSGEGCCFRMTSVDHVLFITEVKAVTINAFHFTMDHMKRVVHSDEPTENYPHSYRALQPSAHCFTFSDSSFLI